MVSRRWGILVVPLVAAVAVVARRVDRVQTGPDAGVFIGLVRNLRATASLTSPTDQFWIRLAPADTVAVLGRVPVPDLGPLYPSPWPWSRRPSPWRSSWSTWWR